MNYHNLTIYLDEDVYNPAEDTFLILEFMNIKLGQDVLEIGTGCGVIALECVRIGANVICTDINSKSIELTRKNIKNNNSLLKGEIEIRYGNLFEPIKKNEFFDVIVFNPPYLPTSKHERLNSQINYAFDGGESGLETTIKFISKLKKYLKSDGRTYFVFSSLSDRKKLEFELSKNNFLHEVVGSYLFDDEHIDLYLITPKN